MLETISQFASSSENEPEFRKFPEFDRQFASSKEKNIKNNNKAAQM
jgi:hypothetical protein